MLQYKIKRRNRCVFFWGLSVLLSFLLAVKAAEIQDESGSTRTSGFYRSSYALVIGIDNYDNEHWKDLKNAAKDASIVGEELKLMGFSVTFKYNLKSSELEREMEDFFYKKEINKNSRLFIWFSGHGDTIKNEGFIVPADAPGKHDPDFKRKAIPIRRFEVWFRLTNAKHVYMVFDSCFSSTIFTKKSPDNKTISLAIKNPVCQFLCSCVDGQYRQDNGDFRDTFIKAIKNELRADSSGDYYLSASEIGFFIEQWMISKTNKGQTPTYGKLKDFYKGDFLFFLQPPDNYFYDNQDNLRAGGKGPKMNIIPGGIFRMGDIKRSGYKDEQPVHPVSVESIAVGLFEVTFDEYDLFCERTGLKKPDDNGWGRGNRPVINVSWEDALEYTKWLSEQTGHTYRLPTEAEWEYMARAGTETKYWWGNEIGENNACCKGCGAAWGWDAERKTAPVGSFGANQFGIYDTVGNVWEWTCSQYTDNYIEKEIECLKKIITGKEALVIRGGAWDEEPKSCRVSHRKVGYPGGRTQYVGFRVVKVLKEEKKEDE